jgi:predicted transcriptional regulator
MALARKKATTIALDPVMNRALSRAAKDRGVSRSEFVRQQLSLVLEQYVDHPKPRCAGIAKGPIPFPYEEEDTFKDLEP